MSFKCKECGGPLEVHAYIEQEDRLLVEADGCLAWRESEVAGAVSWYLECEAHPHHGAANETVASRLVEAIESDPGLGPDYLTMSNYKEW